jgi:hypothetical protein
MSRAIAALEAELVVTNCSHEWASIVEALEGLNYSAGRVGMFYEFPVRLLALAA